MRWGGGGVMWEAAFAAGVAVGAALAWAAGAAGGRGGGGAGRAKGAGGAAKGARGFGREELKLALCVNDGLKMGKGKVAAQCAHAGAGVVEDLAARDAGRLAAWRQCGQPKIALKAGDDADLRQLAQRARALGLPTHLVCDAGRTQIAAGSKTVLAVGPGPRSVVDQVTGHLKLL